MSKLQHHVLIVIFKDKKKFMVAGVQQKFPLRPGRGPYMSPEFPRFIATYQTRAGDSEIMRILIVDDNLHNRMLLVKLLSLYGNCDTVVNGREAVESFECAIEEGDPYRLVCLDIMMPEMDGQDALKRMRQLESEHGPDGVMNTAIFMTSALDTGTQVVEAFFRGGCTDYLTKPITHDKQLDKMREHRLVLDLPGR